ncbi:hypothetical protein ACFLYN_06250 [Chloroflexota bacterium]
MKKRLFIISATVTATIMLGYLFFLSLLLSLLATKYIAGNTVGEQGKFKSIVIPIRKWGIHIHHWIYSLCLIAISSVTGMYFLSPTITYGLLGGLVFQGIYYYSDWHVIMVNRHNTRIKER